MSYRRDDVRLQTLEPRDLALWLELDSHFVPGYAHLESAPLQIVGVVAGRVLTRFPNPNDELGVTYVYTGARSS